MNEKSDNLPFSGRIRAICLSRCIRQSDHIVQGWREKKAKTRPAEANSSSKQLRPWPPFQTERLQVFG